MTQCDKILAVLKAANGGWVELTTLAVEAGCHAVSERVSELRRKRGYQIENKVLKTKTKLSRALILAEVLFALLVAFVIAPAVQDWWKLSEPVTLAVACIIVLFSTKIFTRFEREIEGAKKGEKDES